MTEQVEKLYQDFLKTENVSDSGLTRPQLRKWRRTLRENLSGCGTNKCLTPRVKDVSKRVYKKSEEWSVDFKKDKTLVRTTLSNPCQIEIV